MGKNSKKRRSGGSASGGERNDQKQGKPKHAERRTTSGTGDGSDGDKLVKAEKKSTSNTQKQQQVKEQSMNDWISSLAKQNVMQLSSESLMPATSNKEERKERRAAKKRQREERKAAKAQAVIAVHGQERREPMERIGSRHHAQTRQRLERLADHVEHCGNSSKLRNKIPDNDELVDQQSTSTKKARREKMRLHHLIKNKLFQGENKVHCLRKRNWDSAANIQPRANRDYSGMGLARPSLLLSFSDPSWVVHLEHEFAQHVPGFFKRRQSKADKKQRDGKMLWRQLQQQKQGKKETKKKKSKESFLTKLSPDERVEAMLQAGIL